MVEPLPVGRAQPRFQRLPLVGHTGEDAAPRHHRRIGGEGRAVGVMESSTEQPCIKGGGRHFRRVEIAIAAPRQRIARIAGRRQLDRTEAGAGADHIADRHVEGRPRQAPVGIDRDAGADADPAADVRQVGLAVEWQGEVAQDIDLVLERLDRGQLDLQLIILAGGAGEPARRIDAQPPEPGAEADRHRRAGRRHGGAVAVEEDVEQRQADGHGHAVDHAAQGGATIEGEAHGRSPSRICGLVIIATCGLASGGVLTR